MELHVLGADGGALLEYQPSGFLFNHRFLLDAGTVCSALSLDELARIDHIFISHSHVDHIKDLGLLADLLIGRRESPIQIYATATTLQTLREHYFNNKIWPDFTIIPDAKEPAIQLNEIQPRQTLTIDGISITPIPVNHTVETCGFLVSWDDGQLLYSADTGPTELLWEVANQCTNLHGVILDVAFPSRMQFLADISGHLSPSSAAKELEKLADPQTPVFFFHLKPAFHQELRDELASLMGEYTRRRVLRSGERITLG